MLSWQSFENACLRHLCNEYGEYAQFLHEGNSDSTVSDIRALPYRGGAFYIEVKEKKAQCGQFVLIPDTKSGKFLYSPKNRKGLNVHSKRIIERMNLDFSKYADAGTAGKIIDFGPQSQDVFGNWIIDKYLNQGVMLMMTDGFLIFPIERFKDYFDIRAVYRVKKSGSGPVPKNRMSLVRDYVLSHEFGISNLDEDGGMSAASGMDLDKNRFKIGGDEYMFSKRGKRYEIRKLSDTCNANVIFDITLKADCPKGLDREGVIAYFEK